MKAVEDFNVDQIPFHSIVFVTTSEIDYEMDRTLLVEHWPKYGDYTIISGSHFSRSDFSETKWDGTTYTKDELKALAKSWEEKSCGSERIIAPLISKYF